MNLMEKYRARIPEVPVVVPKIAWVKTDKGYEGGGFRIVRLKGAWQLNQRTPYVDRIGAFDTLAKAKARAQRLVEGVARKRR